MIETIDAIHLNFDSGSLVALNVILGLIMFGVALSLKVSDFQFLLKRPWAPMVALFAQFLVLPAATWALTRILGLPPSISLGMILVASCPGGNMSNFIAHITRANTALSISVTAVSTACSVVMTPLNVTFWGSMSPDTAAILNDLHIAPMEMLGNVFVILGIPMVLGMTLRARFPKFALALVRPFKLGSIGLFALLLVVAFHNNLEVFAAVIGLIFFPVALHNALAWTVGYGTAMIARLPGDDRRAISIEVAIQNSGLGLVLIFGFFDGLGGMAIVAGWWGIWHIIAGFSMASFWNLLHRKRTAPLTEAES